MDRTDYNIRDSYRLYVKLCKEKGEVPQDIKVYTRLANAYNKFLIDKVFEGEEVTLPAKMGTMMIVGKKEKVQFYENGNPNLVISWARTKKLWEENDEARAMRKPVYCTNEHSNGVRYKFFWSLFNIPLENKSLYNIRMTRTNKRRVYNAVHAGTEFFIKQQ